MSEQIYTLGELMDIFNLAEIESVEEMQNLNFMKLLAATATVTKRRENPEFSLEDAKKIPVNDPALNMENITAAMQAFTVLPPKK